MPIWGMRLLRRSEMWGVLLPNGLCLSVVLFSWVIRERVCCRTWAAWVVVMAWRMSLKDRLGGRGGCGLGSGSGFAVGRDGCGVVGLFVGFCGVDWFVWGGACAVC